MFAELYVLTGRDAGKGLTATPGPSIYLGRAATNQLRIRDSIASRVHCRIDVGADGLTLHDNESGNGTFVNGERVAGSRRLDDGDTIRIGTTDVRVLIETETDRARWGSLSAPAEGEGARSIRVAPRDGREASTLSASAETATASAELSASASASATTESLESLSETWVDARDAAPPQRPPTARHETARASGKRALREVLPGYVLEARLGGRHREGMAVYRARQRSLDRVVAVRVLVTRAGGGLDPLLREARAIARLPHPHVVVIHDLIQRGSIQALVMEFLGGGSLLDRLENGPSALPLAQSLTLAEGVATALAYAHEHGIVHRNVRPSNVLFAPESGSWKLCDFGAAAGPAQPRAGDTTFLGTPLPGFGYLAPEQLGQDPAADPRIDVYGLGATLHACLTGRPPFQGETTPEIGAAIMRDPPPPVPNAPDSLQRLIARCLAKDPKDRWPDGRALLHELGACRAALSSLDDGS